MTKILFLTNIPMIHQHRIDMYVDAIAQEFSISLWDLSAFYGHTEKALCTEQDSLKINSLKEFKDRLSDERKKGLVVVITNILIHNLRLIYPIIHEQKIAIVNINKDSFASWMYNVAAIRNCSMVGLMSCFKAALHHYAIPRLLLHWYRCGATKYDYQLSSFNFFPEDNKSFIKIHNIKYDESSRAKSLPSIIDGEYILFLDAALADHPMFANENKKINRAKYLQQLNNYFTELEIKYNLPVIISAHPKSNYDNRDFNGRCIIMYKTPVLIQHAQYIVSHYTTSLYDVILQNKPFKVLYSKELIETACANTVLAGIQVGDFVNAERVCLDDPILNDFTVDIEQYNVFKYKYLVNREKSNFSNNELIVGFLKTLTDRDV